MEISQGKHPQMRLFGQKPRKKASYDLMERRRKMDKKERKRLRKGSKI
jgi:hypothetical protein